MSKKKKFRLKAHQKAQILQELQQIGQVTSPSVSDTPNDVLPDHGRSGFHRSGSPRFAGEAGRLSFLGRFIPNRGGSGDSPPETKMAPELSSSLTQKRMTYSPITPIEDVRRDIKKIGLVLGILAILLMASVIIDKKFNYTLSIGQKITKGLGI